ncbi:dihydroorotase [Rossellomorea marisflavi]|uniref:dihydroorotase n=1 Tax=Rossellomorea marisflavi TaxID=189381 RepID=UPI000700BBCF|nr:dihydroorotase [Rossellomorea marisflavi]KQU60436.1 dihydroorotase [Bacillus sp. Leaf406]MDW4526425.1 dihydroorotase [Rossellomorea marisflavi]UKS67073.1 dihydroorotase [Rossellomorea marisflavi]WJV17186.1 dihydroorotase [Rossellomorea marisflavi]
MNWLIKHANILNAKGELEPVEVKTKGNKIAEIGTELSNTGEMEYDARGMLLSPGFVDLHVHLREPGGEHKETIETGTKAAAKGGYTTIAAMPNTRPVPDDTETLDWLHKRINETASVRVLPYGAITERQAGKELNDLEAMKQHGAFAFTDDGVGVQSAAMMLEAMKKAAAIGASIVAHCEENTLINKGSVHEGRFSALNGLNGIPSVCEAVHIARDVLLAEAAGTHYHVCHISTKESVRVVRDAKRAGIKVTAEVTPHHLLLCEDDIPGMDTNFKMNPPLRGKEDRDALIEGLLDGTIDFIATDHAPHTTEEKGEGMELSPFGIVGLETAFPLLHTHFVQKGIITLKQLIDWMTVKPSEAFNLPFGTLKVGGDADFTLIDLEKKETIHTGSFLSKGKNTPFSGWECTGYPQATFYQGQQVWNGGEA